MAVSQALEPFVWGSGGAQLTPEEIARRREIAQALAAKGMDFSPVGHWTQGLARVAQGLVGGLEERRADEASKQNADYSNKLIASLMSGGEVPATPAAPAATAPASAAPAAASTPPVASIDPSSGTPTPAAQPPILPDVGTVPALTQARSRYASELQDPAIASRLAALTHAEVGSQGPQAQQAFVESTLNRAAARNQTLADAMSGGYFPAVTHQRVAQFSANPQITGRYGDVVKAVLGGSNVGQYATGNASGSVGFNSGPQVAAFGGERFGIEGPDQAWVRRLQGGAQPAAAPVQVASADPTFMPPSGAPIFPVPGADPIPARPTPGMQNVAQALAAQPAPQPSSPGVQRVAQAMPPQGMGIPAPIMEALTSPYASPGTKAVAQALLARQPKPLTPAEQQVQQLQIQKLERDLRAPDPDSRPSDIREYEYAVKQGFKGTFQNYQIAMKEAGKPSTSVNIDQKAQGALEKTFGEQMGKTFGSMYEEGVQANQDLAQIDRLRGFLGQSGSGLGPALTNVAAGFGINLGDGAGPGQAASAIISYLTPRQRVTGSGSSSDRDLAMFKGALASMMNTPEGNNLIIDTMQGLAEHKRAMGDIAGMVAMQEIDPKEAIARIRALPDPYAKFKASQGQQPQGGQEGADGWTTLPNGVRVRQKAQ
ncbi:hypothetical protein [Xanthobacter autotrophicus]|uniref:hypothetical protein n=1 Tax=Xanthobacter autotrophicus TaxID=280 RepID=UPI00372787CC